MASEVRVDTIQNRSGLGTITVANAGVGIGITNPSDSLTILGKIQVQQDSSSNNRLIFRGTAGSSYRWNIDNYSTSNTFRIFREDDATAANGVHWAGITSTGDFQFNSGYGSAGTVYGCRAWINLNGTGTIATRASGNVSSISDQGTGDTIVNFTTALPDANFCWTATAENQGPGSRLYATLNAPNTTSSLRVITYDEGGTAKDSTYVFVAVFR